MIKIANPETFLNEEESIMLIKNWFMEEFKEQEQNITKFLRTLWETKKNLENKCGSVEKTMKEIYNYQLDIGEI